MNCEKDKLYPRVLVISNNCLSQHSSNGRTLRNFLVDWPKENLAQFYIHGDIPDFSVCDHFYRVTDGQALRAFCCKGRSGGAVTAQETEALPKTADAKQGRGRNAMTMLARETVWNSGRWGRKAFGQWVKEFDPQLVLLQAGDCGFMFRLARNLAKRHQIPLVIYNSEGYYFKKFDYFRATGFKHKLYPVFYRKFCREFRKTMADTKAAIYICEALQQDYDKEFATASHTVYTATEVRPAEKKPHEGFVASYLGNLGVGRHEPLIAIANALQRISPELHLDVYGKAPNEQVQAALESCPGICLKGFVPYEQVVEVMQQSDLLVHGESRDPFYREDLKYGFSTKIADSLASGTCFFVYAPEELACARYLREQQAAYVVSGERELKDTLRLIVTDPEAKNRYLSRAAEVVGQNHTTEVSAKRFQDILRKAAEECQ